MKLQLRKTATSIALGLAAWLAVSAPAATAGERVTQFPLPAESADPHDVAAGPDGALWTSDSNLGRVWRITPSGKLRSFDVGGAPAGITAAHGALWFTDIGEDRIVRLALDGTTTHYPLTAGAFPIDIVEGSDGALWFTEGRGDKIGRLAPDGTLTEYPLPTRGAFAGQIALGPDGAVWFTEQAVDKIGRVTPSGDVQEFPLPAGTLPGAIAAGPDGAIWFAERDTNAIGRMTTGGELTDEFPLASDFADPMGIVAGPDGALWIAQREAGTIARMTPAGVVTREFRVPGSPDGLTLGPDAALWFPQGQEAAIGRLDPGFDPPLTAAGTTFTARAFVRATHTVATFRDADPGARPSDYRVRIAWGDGTRSAGTVVRTPGGGFAVRARHTFFVPRTHRVVVRISDGVGKGADAEVESTAHVHR